jgi:hypothetical protein
MGNIADRQPHWTLTCCYLSQQRANRERKVDLLQLLGLELERLSAGKRTSLTAWPSPIIIIFICFLLFFYLYFILFIYFFLVGGYMPMSPARKGVVSASGSLLFPTFLPTVLLTQREAADSEALPPYANAPAATPQKKEAPYQNFM